MDSELQAMSAIDGALSGLDEDARGRVLRWAFDRHKVSPSEGQDRVEGNGTPPPTDDASDLADLADLYHRASPNTDAERALVTAYWVQQSDGSDFFEGYRVNSELKNLGHGLSNVTRALDALISQRPAPVIQVRKSGTSKQARKRYRITDEGIRRVRQMVGAAATSEL